MDPLAESYNRVRDRIKCAKQLKDDAFVKHYEENFEWLVLWDIYQCWASECAGESIKELQLSAAAFEVAFKEM